MSGQTNIDWQRVRAIFDSALAEPHDRRDVYLAGACGGDIALLAEVESLLASHESAELFLETPAVIQVVDDSLADQHRLSRGSKLLHYEIRELIGSGGMGEVYLARDTRLNRNVAVKLLRKIFLPDEHASRRLLREARAAALLEHPNICQTYEISEAAGHSFIVMQYVAGKTLADLICGRRPSIAESLELTIQIVEGLAEAHSQGIVHRDIKPANIMVNEKGQAKILDFGLAKFIEAETKNETAQRLHSSGAVMGTVPFMSPEQLRGKPVDARTDIFSVGALLYELVAGKPAFNRDSNAETISAIINEEPDWTAVQEGLQTVLQKCLAKDVRERYASSSELLANLRSISPSDDQAPSLKTDTSPNKQGTTDPKRKRQFYFWQSADDVVPCQDTDTTTRERTPSFGPMGVASIAALALVVIASVGIFYWQNAATAQPSFDSLRAVQLVTWKSGAATSPTDFRISRDGRMIAYSSSQLGGSEAIYIKQTSDGQELRVTNDRWTNLSPLWSPDGQQIAFVSIREGDAGIYVTPTLGGAITALMPTGMTGVSLRHWSRDGASIYYDKAGNLHRLDVRTGEALKVTDLPDTPGVSGLFFAVSPDESRIAFTDGRGQRDLWVMRLDNAEVTRLTNDSDAERRPVWHPDGERLFYNVVRNDSIHIMSVEVDARKAPVDVTRGEGKYTLIDVSPNGDRIYYSTTEPRSDVSSVDVETGRVEDVAAESVAELWADVSPDSKSIVYHTNASKNPSGRIDSSSLVIETAGEKTKKLLANGGFDARWLPDNRSISMFRKGETESDPYQAWVVDTVTGNESRVAAESLMPPSLSVMPIARTEISVLDFSPDSQRVVYLDRKRPQNVKLAERGSEIAQSLTTNASKNIEYSSPKFSRDGNQIAFVSAQASDDRTVPTIRRVHLYDGGIRELYSTTEKLRLIGWSANGDIIVAVASGRESHPLNAALLEVSRNGKTRRISELNMAYVRTLSMARDGSAIAYTAHREDRDDIWIVSLLPGSPPRQVTTNGTTRQFLVNLVFSPDGNRIYFDKQEEINTISVFENVD